MMLTLRHYTSYRPAGSFNAKKHFKLGKNVTYCGDVELDFAAYKLFYGNHFYFMLVRSLFNGLAYNIVLALSLIHI